MIFTAYSILVALIIYQAQNLDQNIVFIDKLHFNTAKLLKLCLLLRDNNRTK